MTLPGLSAFYGGLVKRKNQLSVFMQCLVCACVASVMWFSFGYSLCFADAPNAVVGGLGNAFMKGITVDTLVGTLPEALWALYQMTFAVITPALMIGAFVERMKFNASIIYMALWSIAVYYPACHLIWGGGALAAAGVVDFAGGIVVHVTAGVGALVACHVLGPRKNNTMVPGNILMTLLGTGMLWVGWFGFNGGSAAAAGTEAAFANLCTHLSASIAALVWMFLDYLETGKTSAIGTCTGAIAGLAAITPAAGSVGPLGGIIIGTLSAIICRFFSTTVKEKVGYDDSLDVFGVHGVGGFVGTLALAFFGAPMFGGFSTVPMMEQFGIQLAAATGVALYTAVASFVCLKITGVITGGIRVAEEVESGPEGLDGYSHGEAAYTLEEGELPRSTVPALA
uniref:Ammonium transporter n=1 Tax=Prasinoderma coloniale TaxID=156133 RepID=A0A7R9TKY3_9VIRI|mmetsp:Transcript_2598/g.10365  ORF Transcript_2598/g.10365 Transcript_2598/m.10365 type:complete len:397 (+) Transcript_2598:2-1192(+)